MTQRVGPLVGRAAAPVAVGLPVYNGEPYLEAALRSLLRQSDVDAEFVIADNCSTDGTEEICRDAAARDPRVRYLRRDRNVGAVENHNRLVHETASPLFGWAAADDEYRLPRLARLCRALAAAPSAVLAFSAATEIDPAGRPIGSWHNRCRTDLDEPHQRVAQLLTDPTRSLQLYGVIRREVLLRTGLIPPVKSGDRVLVVDLALHGPFVDVDEELLLRRNHEQRHSRHDAREYSRNEVRAPRRVTLPVVEELRYMLRAIRKAPLTPAQRLRTWAALRPWLTDNAAPMARNVARSAAELARLPTPARSR